MTKKQRLLFLIPSIVLLLCLSVVPAFADVGDESFQANLEQFPGLWDDETGMTAPVFNYTEAIFEEVWVEVPVDSDLDGVRDLIKLYIARPKETEQDGITVPVILEQSPYREGTYLNNMADVMVEQEVNPDTTGKTYADVSYDGIEASDWPWSDAADATLNIPAARVPESEGAATRLTSATGLSASTWYSYFIPRGYAVIMGCNLGTLNSTGFTSSCDVDEIVAAMAIIKWLNGEVRAYTDTTGTVEVKATGWSNGNVAMTGVSYPGTLPIATATSGVEGLKAIIPVAALSSWYNYYRDNGSVHGPGGYQGEDAWNHAEYNLSRGNNPTTYTEEVRALFDAKMRQMDLDSDRTTGDYNKFWDLRNFLRNVDNIKAGVIIMHGLNDNNVQFMHADLLYRAMKASPTNTPVKFFIHLGAHTSVWQMNGFLDYAHQWFDYYLYGIDNDVVDTMPEVSIANNATTEWESYNTWPIGGDERQKLYFSPSTEYNAGALAFAAPTGENKETFVDDLAYWRSSNLSNSQINTWETALVNPTDIDAPSTVRLAYVSDVLTESLRLNGTAKVTLDLTPDKGKGTITVAIAEIGQNRRAFGTSTTETIAAHNGINALSLRRYTLSNTVSNYKIVTRAHVDVQNPNPSGKINIESADTNYVPAYYYQTQEITPGQPYTYTFEFTPMDYTFVPGQQIAVLVYSSDYRHSIAPTDVTTFSLNLNNSFIEIPFVDDEYEGGQKKVTFLDFGGTTVLSTKLVDNGATVEEFTAPEKEGYVFTGWLLNGETAYDFNTPVTSNIKLVASYEAPLTESNTEFQGLAASYPYVSEAVTPDFTLSWLGTTLTEGTDYEVVYADNGAVGTATVTVRGLGIFTGEVSKTFEITSAEPKAALNAPAIVYIDGDRYVEYTFTVAEINKASSFTFQLKVDQGLLMLADLEPVVYQDDCWVGYFNYDEDNGILELTVQMDGQGLDVRTAEEVQLVGVLFQLKDWVGEAQVDTELEGRLLSRPEIWLFDEDRKTYEADTSVLRDKATTKISKSILQFDLNGNGRFDQGDIDMIIDRYYLYTDNDPEWDEAYFYDLDDSGRVDAGDLLLFYAMLRNQ